MSVINVNSNGHYIRKTFVTNANKYSDLLVFELIQYDVNNSEQAPCGQQLLTLYCFFKVHWITWRLISGPDSSLQYIVSILYLEYKCHEVMTTTIMALPIKRNDHHVIVAMICCGYLLVIYGVFDLQIYLLFKQIKLTTKPWVVIISYINDLARSVLFTFLKKSPHYGHWKQINLTVSHPI